MSNKTRIPQSDTCRQISQWLRKNQYPVCSQLPHTVGLPDVEYVVVRGPTSSNRLLHCILVLCDSVHEAILRLPAEMNHWKVICQIPFRNEKELRELLNGMIKDAPGSGEEGTPTGLRDVETWQDQVLRYVFTIVHALREFAKHGDWFSDDGTLVPADEMRSLADRIASEGFTLIRADESETKSETDPKLAPLIRAAVWAYMERINPVTRQGHFREDQAVADLPHLGNDEIYSLLTHMSQGRLVLLKKGAA